MECCDLPDCVVRRAHVFLEAEKPQRVIDLLLQADAQDSEHGGALRSSSVDHIVG